MNESDNLIFLSLSQAGFFPEDSDIKSLSQLTNEQFGNIILKMGKKLKSLKGTELFIPEYYGKDLNSKYKDAQMIVEFLKKLGYKGDMYINNILFPSQRDTQRIFEFLIEQLSNSDSNAIDINENFNEKNFIKYKVSQKLAGWAKDPWVLPEIEQETNFQAGSNLPKRIVKYVNTKIQSFRKIIKTINLDDQMKTLFSKKSKLMVEDETIKVITEEDYKVNIISKRIEETNIYLLKKLTKLSKIWSQLEKNPSQQFIEYLTKRTQVIEFINSNFKENNFCNNVTILIIKNSNIKLENLMKFQNEKENGLGNHSTKSLKNKANAITDDKISTEASNENAEHEESNKQQYQRKTNEIIFNIEKDKENLEFEIKDKNSTLQNIIISTEELNENFKSELIKKEESEKVLTDLTVNNKYLLKQIEEKLETFEQIQRMNRSEIKEDEITKEVSNLEKKLDDMITNWEEFTSQAKSKIDELKNNVESKKKEYNFKYEKVNFLKKEIEEISVKIGVKEELANFLKEEYQKIPIDINRNKFINKISELTHNISNEKNNILVYLNDLKNIENQINMINDYIKKVDNEFEDKLFQDAKKDASSKEFYALFIKIRDGYNLIQKNIIDMNIAKTKMKEFENKVDDYQLKLKSYDVNQLMEQVELLKKENSIQFRK